MPTYTNIKTEKLENSEITLTGEITLAAVEQFRPRVMQKLKKNFDLPGFRKGHVPEKVIIERLGEPSILGEIAELALQETYPQIVLEQKLDVVGPPQVTLTKLAVGTPIGFSIKTAVLPEVTLPDYKQIAHTLMEKNQEVTVEETEVDTIIEQIQKGRANTKQGESTEQKQQELTDAFVKTLGDFKDVADFKQKLGENVRTEKIRKAKEQKRVEIGERIIKQATVPLPRIFVESELEKMLGQFKADIKRMGLEYDAYLKKINKTEADLKKEWEKDAEKRAKLQLILNKIATEENISPNRAQVDKEVTHILSHMKEADPERVRMYIETMLTNEEVFKMLEGDTENKNVPPSKETVK